MDQTPPGHPKFDVNSSIWNCVLIGNYDTKWYDHEANMRALSQTWPNVIFTLTGKGEDPDDQWVEYHTNGKVQRLKRPKWAPEPFDPRKLE